MLMGSRAMSAKPPHMLINFPLSQMPSPLVVAHFIRIAESSKSQILQVLYSSYIAMPQSMTILCPVMLLLITTVLI